jgi:hypothetical protein
MASNIIRRAIANAIFKHVDTPGIATPENIKAYAATRFGAAAEVTKSLVSPVGVGGLVDGHSALVNETLVRDEFVQAVFSGSILGKLEGLIEVPALTRVNVETAPVIAPFVGEYANVPGYQGDFGFVAADARKVAILGVFTEELLRMTGLAAEGVISGQLQRALSRGIDKAFTGAQSRDAVSPTGLAAVAVQAASFNAGVLAFTGDLSKANVVVNPLTAITLRSPTEQSVTAAGGVYGGLPVITSYAVPVGKLFIVDGSRVLAYIGGAAVGLSTQSTVTMDDGTGVSTSTGVTYLFQEGKRALLARQYVDFDFVPGAAVEVTLSA